MGFLTNILRKRLVQTSVADYDDGWSVTPITFFLFENGLGRRSYKVHAVASIRMSNRYRLFEAPVLAWVHGGQLPPAKLEQERRSPRASAWDRHVSGGEPPPISDAMSAADRERLSKFLAMLGSDHDGEILNAAKAASALLKSKNLTWADALGAGSGSNGH